MGPELAVGDGALGFWKALRQVYGIAREQRCWVHKTGNVLNKLPKGLQKKAKSHLQEIWMAETRKAGGERLRLLPGSLRTEIRQSHGLPGQGPGRTFDLLRLPRRTLEARAHDQPHREHVCHGSPQNVPHQGLPVPQDSNVHGLQAVPERPEKMEKTKWIKSSRRDYSRPQIRRWRTPGSRRRMISPYTTFDNSSLPRETGQ